MYFVLGTKEKRLIAVIVICSLILIAITACAIYFESLLSLINRADDEILDTMSDAQYQEMMEAMRETVPEDYTGEVISAEDIQWEEEAEDLEQSDDIINLLLIGQDRRPGEDRARSDAIILCTIHKEMRRSATQ